MTQEELAQASGLHANYIGDLERGERNPTLLTVLALARGLRCKLSELVRGPFD
jgi:transcriptional regulator with XRE-family HTH domain